jgi:hypothetical protein
MQTNNLIDTKSDIDKSENISSPNQTKNNSNGNVCEFLRNKLINIVLFERDAAVDHLNNVDKLTTLITEVEKNCTFLT